MNRKLIRDDSGVFCGLLTEESLVDEKKQKVNITMENQPRPRPQTLLRDDQEELGQSFCFYDEEAIRRKADEIVNNLSSEETIQPLTPISEYESPCAYSGDGYPLSQEILHPLNEAYLRVGPDKKYFRVRDYYINDINELGHGGFGTCHSAFDLTTKKPFVVKCNSQDEEAKIQSIKSESDLLSRFCHDNIVCFYGAVLDVYNPYTRRCNMMMELAEHGSLSSMLKENDVASCLSVEQSMYYLAQILQGVSYLHNDMNTLHLDIKPDNILVFDNGKTVKLADFGTSLNFETPCIKLKGVTPHYAAPEVCREETPSFSADIWSTICVFVEMITATKPWCFNKNPDSWCSAILMVGGYNDNVDDIVPLSKLGFDKEVTELCTSVFKCDHKERPTALHLLSKPIIKEAFSYVTSFDLVSSEEEATLEQLASSTDLANKISVTSSIPCDSGFATPLCGPKLSWQNCTDCMPALANLTIHETHDSFFQSDVVQTGACGTSVTGMTSSTTHNRNFQPYAIRTSGPVIAAPFFGRRPSLDVSVPRVGNDVNECGTAFNYKTVQRSVSFSEVYAERGPEIDSPVDEIEWHRSKSLVHRRTSIGCSYQAAPMRTNHRINAVRSPTQFPSSIKSANRQQSAPAAIASNRTSPETLPTQVCPTQRHQLKQSTKIELKQTDETETKQMNFKDIV